VLVATPGSAGAIAQAIDQSSLTDQVGNTGGRQHSAGPVRDRSRPRAVAGPLPDIPTVGRVGRAERTTIRAFGGFLYEQGGARLFRWTRHFGGRSPGCASNTTWRFVTLTVDLGGGVLKEDVDAGYQRRRQPRLRRRRSRALRARLLLAPRPGRGALPGVYPLATAMARPMIAQLLSRSPTKKGPTPRHGCTGKGQRPGPLRRRDARPGSIAGRHRPDARRHGPQSRAGDRVRQGAQHRDHHHQGFDLLDRREPVGPFHRGRHPRRSLDRAASRRLPLDRRPGGGPAPVRS